MESETRSLPILSAPTETLPNALRAEETRHARLAGLGTLLLPREGQGVLPREGTRDPAARGTLCSLTAPPGQQSAAPSREPACVVRREINLREPPACRPFLVTPGPAPGRGPAPGPRAAQRRGRGFLEAPPRPGPRSSVRPPSAARGVLVKCWPNPWPARYQGRLEGSLIRLRAHTRLTRDGGILLARATGAGPSLIVLPCTPGDPLTAGPQLSLSAQG